MRHGACARWRRRSSRAAVLTCVSETAFEPEHCCGFRHSASREGNSQLKRSCLSILIQCESTGSKTPGGAGTHTRQTHEPHDQQRRSRSRFKTDGKIDLRPHGVKTPVKRHREQTGHYTYRPVKPGHTQDGHTVTPWAHRRISHSRTDPQKPYRNQRFRMQLYPN